MTFSFGLGSSGSNPADPAASLGTSGGIYNSTPSAGSVAGGIMQGISSLVNTGYSIYQDQRNYEFSKENSDYQKALNALVMEREDNAIQRRVADMEAAGLSKYGINGAASSSAMSAYSGSAGKQDIKGANLDVLSHILQLEQQAAQTNMAKAEYQFFKDTAAARKKQIENQNAEVASRTVGSDIANVIAGRRNLLDQNEYDFWAGNDFKNFRQNLANNLLGSNYEANLKGLDWKIKSDFSYGRAQREDQQHRRDTEAHKLRYDWLVSQGKDGLSNLVKGLMAELLEAQSSASKTSQEARNRTAEKGWSMGFQGVSSLMPLLLMLLK